LHNNFELRKLRKSLGLAQSEMAKRMGLSLRPYQQLELNPKKIRRRHIRLAESVALEIAIQREDPELAPSSVRKKAMTLARLIIRENIRQKARQLTALILDEE
jgi:transcriptional regulator with XRE-family HTH domain